MRARNFIQQKCHTKRMGITKKCIAFEAPRTFPSEFNFSESVSYVRVISTHLIVSGQIGGADFEFDACFSPKCYYVPICELKQS